MTVSKWEKVHCPSISMNSSVSLNRPVSKANRVEK